MEIEDIESFVDWHWGNIPDPEPYSVFFEVFRKSEGRFSAAHCGYYNSFLNYNNSTDGFRHYFLVNTNNYRSVPDVSIKGFLIHEIGHSRNPKLRASAESEEAAQRWAIEYASKNNFEDELCGLKRLMRTWRNNGAKKDPFHGLAYEAIMADEKFVNRYGLRYLLR